MPGVNLRDGAVARDPHSARPREVDCRSPVHQRAEAIMPAVRRTGSSRMQGTHNHWLLLLSVIVSVMASFVALDSTARVAASRTAHQRAGADGGRKAWYWLL